MSRVRADQYTNNAGTGSPLFTHGVRVTGVATATTFDGDLTGNVTGNADTATTAQGLTGTPNITVGGINATGIITSTGGFNIGISSVGNAITTGPIKTLNFIGAGNTFAVDGTTVDISIAGGGGGVSGAGSTVGILTTTDGTSLNGYKVENGVYNSSASIGSGVNFYLDDGHIQVLEGTTASYYISLKKSATEDISVVMPNVGDTITGTLMVKPSDALHIMLDSFLINGQDSSSDHYWVGGNQPNAATPAGYDIFTFITMKTSSSNVYKTWITISSATT